MLLTLFILLSCIPKKQPSVSFISEPYPAFVDVEEEYQRLWLERFFETATPEEIKSHWSLLLNPTLQHTRGHALQLILQKSRSQAIANAFVANPDIFAYERCYVAIYAQQSGIELSNSLLPKSLNSSKDRVYCALLYAQKDANPKLYQTLSFADLPLELDFYHMLLLFKDDSSILSPIIEEQLKGSEDDFFYITLFCTWFLLDPIQQERALIAYLQQSQEEDRMEAFEFLWNKPEAKTIFSALANEDSYSGIFAKLALTALGEDHIDFTLQYLYSGQSWDLRLKAIEAMGLWHSHNPAHSRTKKVERELIDLIGTEKKDVLIHVLHGLRLSNIFKAIAPIQALIVNDTDLVIERAATIRTLSKKGQQQ